MLGLMVTHPLNIIQRSRHEPFCSINHFRGAAQADKPHAERLQTPNAETRFSCAESVASCARIDGTLHIEFVMPFAWQSGSQKLQESASAVLLRLTGATAIDWKLLHTIATMKWVKDQAGVDGVRNLIAVSSGKGGVGKSSTAVNIALSLAAKGGALDCWTPIFTAPRFPPCSRVLPTSAQRRQMGSIWRRLWPTVWPPTPSAIWSQRTTPWSGEALWPVKALMQLLTYTLWPELDYLILDMPPGTGDIQLSWRKIFR